MFPILQNAFHLGPDRIRNGNIQSVLFRSSRQKNIEITRAIAYSSVILCNKLVFQKITYGHSNVTKTKYILSSVSRWHWNFHMFFFERLVCYTKKAQFRTLAMSETIACQHWVRVNNDFKIRPN